jgi:hypothetical protein
VPATVVTLTGTEAIAALGGADAVIWAARRSQAGDPRRRLDVGVEKQLEALGGRGRWSGIALGERPGPVADRGNGET